MIAELLLGRATPNGRLPVSFPVSKEVSMARRWDHQERYGSIGGDLADPNSFSYFTEGIDNGYRWFIKKPTAPKVLRHSAFGAFLFRKDEVFGALRSTVSIRLFRRVGHGVGLAKFTRQRQDELQTAGTPA